MQLQTFEYVKLQKRGNMTIPKVFRDILGFEEGELVRMNVNNGKLIVEPVKTFTENELKKLKAKGLL